MTDSTPTQSDGWREGLDDLQRWWKSQPEKGLFLILLAAWALLFHFLGNSVFGYRKTSSLFDWMYYVFTTSEEDPHCLYVPLAVLGLFYWKRRILMAIPKNIWWPAFGLVLLAALLHISGFIVQQTRISILAFFLGIYGLMGLLWGREWLRHSFFPMILFFFCIPLGAMTETITLPLRLISSKIAVGLTHGILGIDVIRDGVQIFDSKRTFSYEVAAACSGIRSLLTLLALSTILAFVSHQQFWKRMILILAAFPLAILGNVIRLSVTIIVAEAYGQKAGSMIETKFGFITYLLALVLLLWISHLLRPPNSDPPLQTPAPQPA